VHLAPIGIWTPAFDMMPWPEGRAIAQELEALGYGALWLPEVAGRDVMVASALALDATERMIVGSGTAPISRRDPMLCNAAWHSLSSAHPDRFVLGLGVSHQVFVEDVQKQTYGPPLASMRAYLDGMDEAPYWGPRAESPRRVLAALGPKMLALAAERTDGAQPYNVTPDHTKMARDILGDDKWLIVEQKVVLTTDASVARTAARAAMSVYFSLPNYVNNWKRLGFTDDDVVDGGSDRLLDAMVAAGDEHAIAARVQAHRDAGADHVCVQVLTEQGYGVPLESWRRLAPALVR
jgi:probable F420-dependent oxidoreductase